MALPAGDGRRREGDSGRGQPGPGGAAAAAAAAAAEVAVEGEGAEEAGAAAGDAGFMLHWNQEGLGARRHVWENVHQLQQPGFRCLRGTWGVQPVPRLKGKSGTSNRFAHWQLRELELVFQRTHYLCAGLRKRLAAYLGVCEAKVHNWFKKKRAQYRKYHNA
ncbi:rhox homeobox family member 2B-like [Apodemus sylvaticus]|uniref:rhox homeobox family member 2B-like n=1 Tax=Apodemus sylvaticus TaxID=10129 RepID=UPI00224344B0|nr:rhox homeobox family member 2B-like [Apodemus sylvaticus]